MSDYTDSNDAGESLPRFLFRPGDEAPLELPPDSDLFDCYFNFDGGTTRDTLPEDDDDESDEDDDDELDLPPDVRDDRACCKHNCAIHLPEDFEEQVGRLRKDFEQKNHEEQDNFLFTLIKGMRSTDGVTDKSWSVPHNLAW